MTNEVHAEGQSSKAEGYYSRGEGYYSQAVGHLTEEERLKCPICNPQVKDLP